MSKIRIKHFGPIKEGYQENDGWMEVKKVTMFIGNQGSGKSTVAKLISTLTWIEKAINRGDIKETVFTKAFIKSLCENQRISNYFVDATEIEYEGERIYFSYNPASVYFVLLDKGVNSYHVPKIMYVPAERNFLSTVEKAYNVKNLPYMLFEFAEELRKGQLHLNGNLLSLPIGDVQFEYDASKDISYLKGNNYKVNLMESSSGYQSFVPLYLVSKFLCDELQRPDKISREQLSVTQSIRRNEEIVDVMSNDSIPDDQKIAMVEAIKAKYLNTCFINIVEEPEQNLFPDSQWEMLKSLLAFNNINEGNKLIMTTHSPYLINYLSIAIQGAYLLKKISNSGKAKNLLERLEQVVPTKSVVDTTDVVVYQLDEKTGAISKLGSPEGIPSDKNYLNQSIAQGNQLFDSLLEIEEEL